MRLVVKEANGQLHTLQVEPQYRFGQLQKMIYQAVPSIALDSQKLVLGSRLLNERRNESIKVAGLKDGGKRHTSQLSRQLRHRCN